LEYFIGVWLDFLFFKKWRLFGPGLIRKFDRTYEQLYVDMFLFYWPVLILFWWVRLAVVRIWFLLHFAMFLHVEWWVV